MSRKIFKFLLVAFIIGISFITLTACSNDGVKQENYAKCVERNSKGAPNDYFDGTDEDWEPEDCSIYLD